jgi:threonine/homoserine/homoserine lactone efflux protein
LNLIAVLAPEDKMLLTILILSGVAFLCWLSSMIGYLWAKEKFRVRQTLQSKKTAFARFRETKPPKDFELN